MQPRTAAFDTAILRGAVVFVSAVVQRAGTAIMAVELDPGATVGIDETQASVMTFSGTVADTGSIAPHLATDPLAPYGSELVVQVGVETTSGTIEYIPAGVYRLSVSDSDALGKISLSGLDRSSVIAWARNEQPYAIPAGTTLSAGIGAYIHSKYPSIPYDADPSAALITLPSTVVFLEGAQGSGDPWADAQGLAQTYGYWLRIDAAGHAKLTPVPTPPWPPAAWDYSPGPGNLAIPTGSHKMDTSPNGQPSYNVAVVIGQGPGVPVPVTGSAEITDPTAATYPNPDGFGRRPIFYTSPLITTTAQAQATAASLLVSKQGASENVAFAAVAHPCHEPGDIVHYASDMQGIDATVALSAWTLQLDLLAPNQYRTRSLSIALRARPAAPVVIQAGSGNPNATVPAAPVVTATGGDSNAVVSWTAPNNGGAAITSYTVATYNGVTPLSLVTVNGGTVSTTIAGLTNGTPYTFTVYAANAIGAGPASPHTAAVTPLGSTIPSAPTAVAATAANASAVVRWTVAFDGGSAITSYTVTPRVVGGATLSPTTVGGTPSSITVAGLTNGTSYTFTVHANNNNGQGAESAPSAAVAPNGGGAPTAPGSVTATPAPASVVLTWAAAGDNGNPVTSYTVTPSLTGTPQPVHVFGNVTTATITGLVNAPYTFTVHATNGIGNGPESAPTTQVTPLDLALDTFTRTVTAGGWGTSDQGAQWTVGSSGGGGAPPAPTVNFWGATVPGNIDSGDGSTSELGLRFTTDTAGSVVGMRFYKSAANTGTHTGHLWSDTGTLLASVTFTGETVSGWQSAAFPTPVTLTVGTIYMVSYFAPNGRYSFDHFAFNSQVDAAPLHAVADGTGGNGRYLVTATSAFPTSAFDASNYWVDVTFQPGA